MLKRHFFGIESHWHTNHRVTPAGCIETWQLKEIASVPISVVYTYRPCLTLANMISLFHILCRIVQRVHTAY